ncbi:short-chain dehydrogenase [Aquaticitalea lipolytica]|jgi:short-subunit dehydrogenase|uniref:Short-chain dehydrogenase n=1 Tax=Aquaticitalea lipolytica TaxID=1247562 RepID=A0A8J2TPL4_9FLAO|nr:SDR family oxidoreductase [Aquaticitalea lipolytica]GFZ79065.1 short-chain dehydrogenase [Aquaticitalea lipolytica]
MIKTAIVTGAASGLGYELALLLAKDSYNLILIDIDTINLDVAKQSILESYSVDVKLIIKDLSEENVAEVIFEEIKDTPIDVLINNAGFGLFGTFSDTDWKRELEMLQVHIITTTHLTKLVLDGMIKQKSGKILNMSSLAAFQPGPLMSIYYASKGYMLSFSEAIANELKGTGVTVTALCPGPTKTSFQDVVSNGTTDNKITFNMACPQKVAAYGYKAMHQGKTVAIPGVFNKFLSGLPRFLSRNRATSIVRQIQERNREV